MIPSASVRFVEVESAQEIDGAVVIDSGGCGVLCDSRCGPIVVPVSNPGGSDVTIMKRTLVKRGHSLSDDEFVIMTEGTDDEDSAAVHQLTASEAIASDQLTVGEGVPTSSREKLHTLVNRYRGTSPPTPQIARWMDQLAEFDFEFVHRAGTNMEHVDALSRSPVEEDAEDGCLRFNVPTLFL